MKTNNNKIVTNNFKTQGSNIIQNKCTIKPTFTKKLFSKKQKTSTNDEKSPTLKKFIKKLKILSSASNMQPLITNLENLTKLYYQKISLSKQKYHVTKWIE